MINWVLLQVGDGERPGIYIHSEAADDGPHDRLIVGLDPRRDIPASIFYISFLSTR